MGSTSSSCAVRSRSLLGWMDCGEDPTAWFAHVSVSSPSFPGGMLPLPACPSSCDASFIDKGQGFEPNQAGSPPEGPPFVLVDRHGPSETAVFTRSFSIGGDLSSTLDDRSLPLPRTGSARGSHPFDPTWKGRSLGSVPGSKPGDAPIDEPQNHSHVLRVLRSTPTRPLHSSRNVLEKGTFPARVEARKVGKEGKEHVVVRGSREVEGKKKLRRKRGLRRIQAKACCAKTRARTEKRASRGKWTRKGASASVREDPTLPLWWR